MMPVVLVGLLMTAFCLVLQVGALHMAQRYFAGAQQRATRRHLVLGLFRTSMVLVLLLLGTIIQMLVWAVLYRLIGLFESVEEALYFSGVTFTSLGYGDLVIKGHFRFLAPIEAATGLMMFAIVTAVLIAVIEQEAKAGK
jgi:hypothetical protein